MNDFEKKIYNTYIIVSRAVNNRPFQLRKDFSEFTSKEAYIYVTKLAAFFNKHNHINIQSFFEAPFFVFNEEYFGLDFFCTHKAIKAYTTYHDNYLINSPDSEKNIQFMKDTILFISNFCKEQDISIPNYVDYKSAGSVNNDFIQHIKNRNVNVFVLFAYPSFEKQLNNIDHDLKSMLPTYINKLPYIRTKLYGSAKAKIITQTFKKYLDKHNNL